MRLGCTNQTLTRHHSFGPRPPLTSEKTVKHLGHRKITNVSGLRVRHKLMWRQWQRANNYIHSVQTYLDMSPDLSMRQQVNQSLRQHRQPLSPEAWCQEFQQDASYQNHVLLFIYQSLETYSGIEFNRVRPTDRL